MSAQHNHDELKRALRKVQKTQSKFWEALTELELLLNIELGHEDDYTTYDVDELLRRHRENGVTGEDHEE